MLEVLDSEVSQRKKLHLLTRKKQNFTFAKYVIMHKIQKNTHDNFQINMTFYKIVDKNKQKSIVLIYFNNKRLKLNIKNAI